MHARLNVVANFKKISRTVILHVSYVRIKVDYRLSAVPTLISVVPSHLEGHHRKVEGHIKIFATAFLCPSTFKLLPAPLYTLQRIISELAREGFQLQKSAQGSTCHHCPGNLCNL